MPYHLAKPLSCGAGNVEVKLPPPRQVLKRNWNNSRLKFHILFILFAYAP